MGDYRTIRELKMKMLRTLVDVENMRFSWLSIAVFKYISQA